jgi:signal transduction histidine kinase
MWRCSAVMAELRGWLAGDRPWSAHGSHLSSLLFRRDGPYLRTTVLIVGSLWFAYSMLRTDIHAGRPRLGLYGADLALTAMVVAAVACFLAGIVLGRCAHAWGAVFLFAGSGLGVALYAFVPERPGSAVIFACVGFAGAIQPVLRSSAVALVGSVGMVTVIAVQGRPAGELWTIVGMLGMFAGIRAGRTREAARLTEQQNLVLAERSRIAREIHDILAHSLSAQLVHLEGARLLMVSGRTDEALERVERARGLARSGLEETRRALDTLRGDIPPMDVVLRELAEEHRVLADAACAVTIAGERQDLAARAGLAVIRTAQEALTNVRKHAPGADVTIVLRYEAGWCELEVTDSGGRKEPGPLAASGGGYGLVGMRERAELIGGTLEAGPAGEGFSVLLRVPL